MYTRKQYMSKECSHNEYYGQFVDTSLRDTVKQFIGIERIMKSKDESFNDIELKRWDALAPLIRTHCGRSIARANETGGISLSDCVCTAKQAARQIKASNT